MIWPQAARIVKSSETGPIKRCDGHKVFDATASITQNTVYFWGVLYVCVYLSVNMCVPPAHIKLQS